METTNTANLIAQEDSLVKKVVDFAKNKELTFHSQKNWEYLNEVTRSYTSLFFFLNDIAQEDIKESLSNPLVVPPLSSYEELATEIESKLLSFKELNLGKVNYPLTRVNNIHSSYVDILNVGRRVYEGENEGIIITLFPDKISSDLNNYKYKVKPSRLTEEEKKEYSKNSYSAKLVTTSSRVKLENLAKIYSKGNIIDYYKRKESLALFPEIRNSL